MIAVDTGFIVALLDADDAWHARAMAQRHTASEGWVTTWPVLTECCWLLQRELGAKAVQGLMLDVAEGGLAIWALPEERLAELPVLLKKYAALPMDLADASLLMLAEHLGHGRILTTDMRDFCAYRWKSRKPFVNLMEQTP